MIVRKSRGLALITRQKCPLDGLFSKHYVVTSSELLLPPLKVNNNVYFLCFSFKNIPRKNRKHRLSGASIFGTGGGSAGDTISLVSPLLFLLIREY